VGQDKEDGNAGEWARIKWLGDRVKRPFKGAEEEAYSTRTGS